MSDISRSLEDYVEAIYMVLQENKVARVKDISAMLSVKRPSVTGAIKQLAALELVEHTPYSYITLTADGEKLGRNILRRHRAVRRFFTDTLGIDAAKADEAACRIEHAVDAEIIEKLTRLSGFLETCPRAGADWIRQNLTRCAVSGPGKQCKACIRTCSAPATAGNGN